MGIKVGDRVRFLNSIGGGIVKKIVSKDMVEVEDQDGFDIPTLIKECVVIEASIAEQKKENAPINNSKPKPVIIQETEPDDDDDIEEETKEGEKLNVSLGFVPDDIKAISSAKTDVYLINDSNYYLAYNIYNIGETHAFSRAGGIISPNTKIQIETLGKEQLPEIENLGVQMLAMKKDKTYLPKPAYDIKLRINAVKFYKLHSYTENDFFNEQALIIPLVKDDEAQDLKGISAKDVKGMLEQKETRMAARVSKKSNVKPEKLEIDLHIAELVDNLNGLSNKDMLDIQIKEFHKVMKENITCKGQKIVFIHGKGEGVLRKELLSELKKHYPKCEFQDASFLEYGFGATQITIK